jgi:hypothetical protein
LFNRQVTQLNDKGQEIEVGDGKINDPMECKDRCSKLTCEECIGDKEDGTTGLAGCVWCDSGRAVGVFSTGSCSLEKCSLGERVKQTVCFDGAAPTMVLSVAIASIAVLLQF